MVFQQVSVQGHVIRVSPCRPLVVRALFHCGKCKCERWVHFEDGIYCAPAVCHTAKSAIIHIECFLHIQKYSKLREYGVETINRVYPYNWLFFKRCGNKYLEFLRSSAQVEDYQRIRLQEFDDAFINESSARIPRTFEVFFKNCLKIVNIFLFFKKMDDFCFDKVEARSSLVNLCIPGDVLSVVGTVQTIQAHTPP